MRSFQAIEEGAIERELGRDEIDVAAGLEATATYVHASALYLYSSANLKRAGQGEVDFAANRIGLKERLGDAVVANPAHGQIAGAAIGRERTCHT